MPSDQTRTAILAAAERLYADRGFGDVTLRDIVAEANVNLAAVNYHFGSKDELIAELFVTRSLALNRERCANCARRRNAAAAAPPSPTSCAHWSGHLCAAASAPNATARPRRAS